MVKAPDGEQAIETLRVGQRVTTGSGDDRDADIPDIQPEVADTPIDPDTWRVVQLCLKTEAGEYLTVELLRPLEWLAANSAEPGAVIQLDLPELGASGPAEVVAILPCPEIESGPGRVVTATFHHASGDIYDLRITVPNPDGSGDSTTETIGVTGHHPFWSDTRRTWIPARSLRPGERLRTFDGVAHVHSITPITTPAPVFNIEVDVEHLYFVCSFDVLVHNESLGEQFEISIPAAKGSKRYKQLLALEKRIKNTDPAYVAASKQHGKLFGYRSGNIQPTARVTVAEANWLGSRWAGSGATLNFDGSGKLDSILSKDGERLYRAPKRKPNVGRHSATGVQANF